MSTGYVRAVRVREYNAASPNGIDVWKYTFPLDRTGDVDDVFVRTAIYSGSGGSETMWTGVFECARGRNLEVIPWETAHALVVAAANAVYIVDPASPEWFSGFAAPVGITGVTFDEGAGYLFVAESLRVYAFSQDRLFKWISEPLEGYDAHLRSCRGRVLAIELKSLEAAANGEDPMTSVIRLRTEDGTLLRSRFRRGLRHWMKRAA